MAVHRHCVSRANRSGSGLGTETAGHSTGAAREVARLRILVLGGDGYLGWPTALHLSKRGHDVGVVDNLIRRHYDDEMGVSSLVPIRQLQRRVGTWKEVSGQTIEPFIGDLNEYQFLLETVRSFEPDAIVHFA